MLADCGYSNREPATWASPLRAAGARLVMDLHPTDRGPKGTYEWAISANGSLYCPAAPKALLELGPLQRGASAEATAAHDAACCELARYKPAPLTAPDHNDYQRLSCPAAVGKLRCPLKPSSLAASHERPTVLQPPTEPPSCCAQASITVPHQVNDKTGQAHDYPGPAWRASYARRAAAERSYSRLADPSVGGIRPGWSRLFGLAKNSLRYALAAVVHNVEGRGVPRAASGRAGLAGGDG